MPDFPQFPQKIISSGGLTRLADKRNVVPIMTKLLGLNQVLEEMKKVQGKRTNKDFAAELGISAAYLSDLYLGRREPGPAVLEKMNLERRTVYAKTA